MTVLGPIAPDELAVTLPHEHLIIDSSRRPDLLKPESPDARALFDGPVDITVLGLLKRNAMAVQANLRLDDPELSILEARDFQRAGGRTIVDLTPIGVGRDPKALRAISVATGLNVVMGTAYYTHGLHPTYLADASLEEIAETFCRELSEGADGTGIKAGIIGEIGLSSPIVPEEERVMRAAANAHHRTGAAINLHLSWGQEAHVALAILKNQKVDPRRVILSHLDSQMDFEYHTSIAEVGAFVEFDCFGIEWHFDQSGIYAPWDPERVVALAKLIRAGYVRQLLISHDIFTKIQLKRYGGWGYDHLLTNLLPHFKRAGITSEEIQIMMVENPRRALTIP